MRSPTLLLGLAIVVRPRHACARITSAGQRQFSLLHPWPCSSICLHQPSVDLQAAYAAAAQAQAGSGSANFTAPPPPRPERADLPRLGFISYDMHEALFLGGPSLYDVALAFGNKGYPGGLVFALNQVPAAVHNYDVVLTAGVRLLLHAWLVRPAVHWLLLLSTPCSNETVQTTRLASSAA